MLLPHGLITDRVKRLAADILEDSAGTTPHLLVVLKVRRAFLAICVVSAAPRCDSDGARGARGAPTSAFLTPMGPDLNLCLKSHRPATGSLRACETDTVVFALISILLFTNLWIFVLAGSCWICDRLGSCDAATACKLGCDTHSVHDGLRPREELRGHGVKRYWYVVAPST